MSFLLLILFGSCFGGDSYCKFEIQGRKFDLTDLKDRLYVDLSECGDQNHSLLFDVCGNLDNADCRSEDTEGPSNACDVYHGTAISSYYWIGSPDISYVDYGDTYKNNNYHIYFRGTQQKSPHAQWTRDFDLSVVCDTKVDQEITCIGIEQKESKTIYHMKLTSRYACPKNDKPSAGFWYVNYANDKCDSSDQQIATYMEPECFAYDKNTLHSYDYFCDTNYTYTLYYVNSNCESWVQKSPVAEVGDCFLGEKGMYSQVYCTNNYKVDYANGMFFIPEDTSDGTFSFKNPSVAQLFFPANGDCVQSIVNPNYYLKASCATNFMITIYLDPGCSVPKSSEVLFPGNIKDMGEYFSFGLRKTSYYAMFVECK